MKTLALMTVSVLVLGVALGWSACAEDADTTTDTEAVPTAAAGSESSGLTVGTTEGPYYVTGTAELSEGNLNSTGLPGDPIKISGYVYGGPDSSTPLAGAHVEIWHADSEGSYHPNSNGDAADYDAEEIALRGYVVADDTGYYEFNSIYPCYYQGRTRHIHVRASADGYGAIATQIIVPAREGDGTTPENDAIARSLPEANSVTFRDENGVQASTFDFHLGED